MFAKPPLLIAKQGKEGAFLSWLEDLGLGDFIKRYLLPKLVEWSWLIPQYRVIFPKEYFLAWEHFPLLDSNSDPEFEIQDNLWDSTWCIDDTEEPLWFLHPFFRPEDECGFVLLNADFAKSVAPIPESFIHPYRELSITPYADYFFHWQAYALVDVIRTADCIVPILNTPDIEKQVQGIVRIASRIKGYEFKPSDILKESSRWGSLVEPMTWLSHYRAFRNAVSSNSDRSLYEKGAKELAEYLNIDAEKLELFIKEKLLVLAQQWLWANSHDCIWTVKAWPYLQKDIYLALIWRCQLNGKTIDDYLDEWKYLSMGQREWAELHKVLPFEFSEDKHYFLSSIPLYQKFYQGVLPAGEDLRALVSQLQKTNYPFNSFLWAFRQLHENFGSQPKQKGGIDFRELRPLDFYSMLAIRAEGCLRYALEDSGLLQEISNNKQGLEQYIVKLAEHNNIAESAISTFKANAKNHTQLRDMPENPINKIMSVQSNGLDENNKQFVQAFLCCLLARNYFAHHNYLDDELVRTDESAFMLLGIITTVLVLLPCS